MSDSIERPATPDHLGKGGQSLFGSRCALAGLIPNESNFDRTGWDYVVEWPWADAPSLDQRETPTACHVQVKTVWQETDSVVLGLTAAQRLAVELKPAFVYIYRFGAGLEPVSARVIHVRGEVLGRILKRAREAQRDQENPADVKLSFSIDHWGTEIETSGAAFRLYAESVIGSSMADYAAGKREEFRNTGYGPGRFRLTTSLRGSREDVVNAFLSLGSVEGEVVEEVEERFDIPLPVPRTFPAGAFQFQTRSSEKAELRVKLPEGGVCRFSARVYRAPQQLLPPGQGKLLLRAELFYLLIDMSEDAGDKALRVTFQTDEGQIKGVMAAVASWRDLYALFDAAVEAGPLVLEIRRPRRKTLTTGVFSVNLTSDAQRTMYADIVAVLDTFAAVLKKVRASNFKFRLEDLLTAQHELWILSEIMNGRSTATLRFGSNRPGGNEAPPPSTPLLYFRAFEIGDHTFAHCSRFGLTAEAGEDGLDWTGRSPEFVEAVRFRGPMDGADDEVSDAFGRFIDRCKAKTGVDSHLIADRAASGN